MSRDFNRCRRFGLVTGQYWTSHTMMEIAGTANALLDGETWVVELRKSSWEVCCSPFELSLRRGIRIRAQGKDDQADRPEYDRAQIWHGASFIVRQCCRLL
jgi:hypothetical protein